MLLSHYSSPIFYIVLFHDKCFENAALLPLTVVISPTVKKDKMQRSNWLKQGPNESDVSLIEDS